MVRRPLLEPNLTNGGLVFISVSLFLFLMANVMTSNLSADDLKGAAGAHALLNRTTDDQNKLGRLSSNSVPATTFCTSCRTFPPRRSSIPKPSRPRFICWSPS